MSEPAAKPETTATKKQAKDEFDRSFRGLLSDLKRRPGTVVKDFVQIVGPRNMTRELAKGAEDKHEWIGEGWRHQRIAMQVTTGDRVGTAAQPRELIIQDLVGYIELFARQRKVVEVLVDALKELDELELVQRTTRGRGILVDSRYMRQAAGSAREWREKAETLKKEFEAESPAPDPDSDARVAYARYWREARVTAEILNAKINEAQVDAQRALEFEAMKAIVTNPNDPRYKTYQNNAEAGLKICTNALGGLDAAADIMADVPEGHVKGAAVGVGAAVSVLNVLHVGFDRVVRTAGINRDIATYERENITGAAYRALDKDPFLIADYLRQKRLNDVTLILKVIGDPVVRELKPFAPPMVLGGLWETAKTLILATVDKYEQKRIQKAKDRRAGKDGVNKQDEQWTDVSLQEAARRIADMVGEDAEVGLEQLKEDITDNVFSALNPIELLAGAVIHSVANRIAAAVVALLPADAAQDVDGSKLFEYTDLVSGVLKRALALQFRPDGERDENACPEMTDQKVRVQTVLSLPQTDSNGRRWLVRLMDGRLGHISAKDRTFDELPPDDPFREEEVPTHDHLGRPFAEIRKLDENRGGAGMFGRNVVATYWARIGQLEGIAELRRKVSTSPELDCYFTPEKVARDGFTSWSNRFIFPGVGDAEGEPAGYYDRQLNARITGTWHQPWKGIFLFVDEDGHGSWATSFTAAGNRPGAMVYQVLKSIRHSSDFDLNTLRS